LLTEEDKEWILNTINEVRARDAETLGMRLPRYRLGDGKLIADTEKASMNLISAGARVGGNLLGVGVRLVQVTVRAVAAGVDTFAEELQKAISERTGTGAARSS